MNLIPEISRFSYLGQSWNVQDELLTWIYRIQLGIAAMLLNSLKFKQTWWRKLFFWPTSNASVNTHTYSTTNASVMYLHKSWTHNHKWSPKFYFELLFFKIKMLLVFTDLRNIYNSFSNFAHVGEVGSWTEYHQPASWVPYHMVPQPLHHLFWECQIVQGGATK